jgi:hypothetical protein
MTQKCKLCGGEHMGAHKLREGEEIGERVFYFSSCTRGYKITPAKFCILLNLNTR